LEDDQGSAGTLGKVFYRAEAQAIMKYILERRPSKDFHKKPPEVKLSQVKTPFSLTPKAPQLDAKPGEATIAGMEFLKWIQWGLENEKFMINQAPILLIPGGLLLSSDIFKLFVKENPQFRSAKAVQESFAKLGFHDPSPNGQHTQTYFNPHNQLQVQGMLINNPNLLLPESFRVVSPAYAIQNLGAPIPTSQVNLANTQSMTPQALEMASDLQVPYAQMAITGIYSTAPNMYIAANGRLVPEAPRDVPTPPTPQPTTTTR